MRYRMTSAVQLRAVGCSPCAHGKRLAVVRISTGGCWNGGPDRYGVPT